MGLGKLFVPQDMGRTVNLADMRVEAISGSPCAYVPTGQAGLPDDAVLERRAVEDNQQVNERRFLFEENLERVLPLQTGENRD